MIYCPILSGSKGLKSFNSFTESEMSLKEEIIRKAVKNPKRILFPEGEDERILQAASELAEKGIGEPVLRFLSPPVPMQPAEYVHPHLLEKGSSSDFLQLFE